MYAHNFKARTTNRRKGLTVTLARTLCGVPWSAPCPPHACHSHGGVGTPARLAHTADCRHFDSLWCSVPAHPLQPTPHKRVASDTRQLKIQKKTHSLMSTHLVFQAKMCSFTKADLVLQLCHSHRLGRDISGIRVPKHSDDCEKATFHTLLHPEVFHVQVPNSSDSRPVGHPHRCRAVHRHHQR